RGRTAICTSRWRPATACARRSFGWSRWAAESTERARRPLRFSSDGIPAPPLAREPPAAALPGKRMAGDGRRGRGPILAARGVPRLDAGGPAPVNESRRARSGTRTSRVDPLREACQVGASGRNPARSVRVARGAALAALAMVGVLQPGGARPAAAQEQALPPGGIPVTSELVSRSCSRCHAQGDDGLMSRISYLRKTPEGWSQSIRRMVSLNGLSLEPAEAREIVRYLSNRHGLAPEELRPALYEVERRHLSERPDMPEIVRSTCTVCHSVGRIATQRRTPGEWELLTATHRGLYPLID